jgi:hypothetical protein
VTFGYATGFANGMMFGSGNMTTAAGFLYGGWKIYQQLKNTEYTDNGLLPHPFKPGTDSM